MQISRRGFLKSISVASVAGSVRLAWGAEKVSELSALIQKGGMGPPAEVALKMYEKAAGIKVVLTPIPWEAQFEKTMAEFVAKSTTFDLIPVQHGWRGACHRFVENLGPFNSKFGPPPQEFGKNWDMGMWRGQLIGLPFRVGLSSLYYYRKDLFDQYGLRVPNSLEEYEHNARVLKEKANVFGVSLHLGGADNTFDEFQNMLYVYGGRWLNETEDAVAPFEPNGVMATKLLEAWKRWFDAKLAPPGVMTWGILDVLSGFQQGVTGQATMFSPRVTLVEDPSKSKVAGKVGYSLLFPGLPQKDLVGSRGDAIGGWNFSLNKWISDARKDAAYQAIKFMVGKDAQLAAAVSAANGPARQDVIENPEFRKVYPAWEPLLKSLGTAKTGLSIPQQPQIAKAVGDEVHEALLGRKTPLQAMRTVWKTMEDVLKAS
jgi:multiple sugar transport system substrate-binding protein